MSHSQITGILEAPMREENVSPGAGEGSMDDELVNPAPSQIPNN